MSKEKLASEEQRNLIAMAISFFRHYEFGSFKAVDTPKSDATLEHQMRGLIGVGEKTIKRALASDISLTRAQATILLKVMKIILPEDLSSIVTDKNPGKFFSVLEQNYLPAARSYSEMKSALMADPWVVRVKKSSGILKDCKPETSMIEELDGQDRFHLTNNGWVKE